jgi:hypothetical protein
MKLFRVVLHQDEPSYKEDHKLVTPIKRVEMIYAASNIGRVWSEAQATLFNTDEIVLIEEVSPAVFILEDEEND